MRISMFAGIAALLAGLGPLLFGCAVETESSEPTGELTEAVTQTHAYLRCNATGWNVGEANRMKPTADPNVFVLDYTVSLPYLATQSDSCLFTETNQLNGWGTAQTNYQAIGGTLNVPGNRTLQVGWQNILIRYPALGAYRATYNVSQKRLSVATQPVTLWRWPLAGQNGRDWIINNYVDGPGAGADDYNGGTRTYPGHAGVDIDISTFRNMDAGVNVMSVGAGQVISLEETQPDRNLSCMGSWNHVTVRAPDGSTFMYGHLRRNSVVVNVGDQVQAGTVLGQVGSSGCSTAPHLHLEAYNPQGALIDPFKQNLWQSPPAYNVPLQIMDLIVNDFFYGPEDSLIDPAPNVSQINASSELTIGLSVGGGSVGDAPGIRILRPDGSQYERVDFTFDFGPAGHTFWIWGWFLEPIAGTWRIQSLVNGQVERTWPLEVVQ